MGQPHNEANTCAVLKTFIKLNLSFNLFKPYRHTIKHEGGHKCSSQHPFVYSNKPDSFLSKVPSKSDNFHLYPFLQLYHGHMCQVRDNQRRQKNYFASLIEL